MDTVAISALFDEAFFEGLASFASSVPDPFPVAIAGHRYMVDFGQYNVGLISPLRDARDTNGLPGETSLNPAAAWKRNRDDWTLGAGQRWADRALEPFNVRIELEPRQFHSSKGIDPWTLGEFKLLPDTELIVIGTTPNAQILAVGPYVYRVDGGALQRTSDLQTVGAPTLTNITGLPGGTINDITTDGQHVYIATVSGIYTHDISGTTAVALAAPAATTVASLIEWANGWLFIAVNNVLSEVRPSGAVNVVYTHPNTGFRWVAVTGTPGAIYVGGQAADVNEVFSINVATTGALGVPIHALSLPRGEFLRGLAYYGNFVLIGSSKGLRLAEIAQGSTLTESPLIRTNSDVTCMWAEGQYVWFGWSNYDGTSTGLGRADLSVTSDNNSFIPAYATDLMYTGQGAILSVCRFLDKTYFLVSGVGIIRPERTGKYVASGTMVNGRFRWGTYEPKVFLGAEIVTDALDGAVAVTCLLDDSSSVSIGLRNKQGETGLGNIIGVSALPSAHDWFEPSIILTPDVTLLKSPVVHRVTFRALPVPKLIEQFSVPLIMASDVNLEAGEGQDVAFDAGKEYDFLKSLVAAGAPIIYQEGHSSHLVIVRDCGYIEKSIYGMNPQRTGLNGLLMVTMLTAEW